MEFKKNVMTLEDRVREFEDKQFSDSFKKVENERLIEDLKSELREVKLSKEKECRDMILKIDELMVSVGHYDNKIMDMEN